MPACVDTNGEGGVFRTGLNPYGLTYTLGLQGSGGPRANPNGRGLDGFIEIAQQIGAAAIELHNAWLVARSDAELQALGRRLADLGMLPIVSHGLPWEGPDGAIRSAQALGASLIRTPLTPVLCGDRAANGEKWHQYVDAARAKLGVLARAAAAAGVTIAIENHQDFGSRELLALCDEAGPNVGVCFDTGNTFPVAEAPLDFARRVAPRVRHVHFKDYRAQWTDEGYRLVRCAIGDGAVPFREIAALLGEHHATLTASLEPGALEARHVRLFTAAWWNGYPPVSAPELARCLEAARRNRIADDEDWRTPWERQEGGDALIGYELDMIRRSASNMKAIGLM
jgi:sugar phosphate isomerase/epimerase